jgi:hypothetical protein
MATKANATTMLIYFIPSTALSGLFLNSLLCNPDPDFITPLLVEVRGFVQLTVDMPERSAFSSAETVLCTRQY